MEEIINMVRFTAIAGSVKQYMEEDNLPLEMFKSFETSVPMLISINYNKMLPPSGMVEEVVVDEDGIVHVTGTIEEPLLGTYIGLSAHISSEGVVPHEYGVFLRHMDACATRIKRAE